MEPSISPLAQSLYDDMQMQTVAGLASHVQITNKSYARDTGMARVSHFNVEQGRLVSAAANGKQVSSRSITNKLPMPGESRGLTNDGSAILG